MNNLMQNYYPTFKMYQDVRNGLMDSLSDDDLHYSPGGENPPLGTLCREIGEIETSYIQSFKTFTQNFNYRNETPALESSVAALKAWYAELDTELKAIVSAFSDAELQNKIIDRGDNFKLTIQIQLDVYKEALLIFYGKVMVYLKAMGKQRPYQLESWIG